MEAVIENETVTAVTQNKKSIDDVKKRIEEMQKKLGGPMKSAPKSSDPLKDFFVVELTLKGAQKAVRKVDDRVMQAVSMLDRDQRSRFGKLKVQFYRQLLDLSSFRVQDKYVIPQRNMPSLDSFFRSLEGEFDIARKETFDYLKANWATIVANIKIEYPSWRCQDLKLHPGRTVP